MKGKQGIKLAIVIMVVALLQGCLYPKELRKENQNSVREGIMLVQHAVDEYQRKTGLLPLITAGESVSRYEKYEVDFQELLAHDLISEIPKNAFQSGGHHRYLIVNEETKPLVRVMDLNTAQRVNDLERSIRQYKQKQGKLPLGDERYPGFYDIDEKLLNVKLRPILSPYSGEALSFMANEDGNVFADYASDLMKAIEQVQAAPSGEEEDLRPILVEAGMFTPVKSTGYQWEESMPIPVP